MKLTPAQFEIIKSLDESGQIHLVDKELEQEYLSILRFIEVKKAGLEIKGAADEINLHSTDRVPSETFPSGLHPSNDMDARQIEREGMDLTPLSPLDGPCDDNTVDYIKHRQAPVRLASARRSWNAFRR